MSAPVSERIGGTIPAVVTPFTHGGEEVDLDSLDRHVTWLHEHGIRCLAPLGTNGEGPSLSSDERRRVIDLVGSHASGIAFVPGTGCTALPETIALSRHALDRGAAAVLVAPPSYFPATPDGVVAYFAALLAALPGAARVFLYHIPRYTGVPIEVETVVALRRAFGARVAGVKDSGGSLEHSRAIMDAVPDLVLLSGSDGTMAEAYRDGAHGVVSALANFAPEQVDAVRTAVAEGGTGEDEQRALSALRELTHAVPQRSALKVLVSAVTGLPRASVRPPLVDLREEEAEELRARFGALRSGRSASPRRPGSSRP